MLRKQASYLKSALWRSLSHDAFGTAKAAAYSGMLMLFPGLMVATSLLAVAPNSSSLLSDLRDGLEVMLPGETMKLVLEYFQAQQLRSLQAVLSAAVLGLLASMGCVLSLMEGFRRAYRLPRGRWGFWKQRARALLLIPTCLLPLMGLSLLVIFGHQIELWMIDEADHDLRLYVILLWRMVRWILAMISAVSVLTLVYHFGTERPQERWRGVLAGALVGALLWFPSTLAFGWYVTRFVNYAVVYGSLGAGIATLVWLYLTFCFVLLGAEFNAVRHGEKNSREKNPQKAAQLEAPPVLMRQEEHVASIRGAHVPS